MLLRAMCGSSVVAAASCAVTTDAPQWQARRRGRDPTRPVSGPCQRHHTHALVAAEVQAFPQRTLACLPVADPMRLWIPEFEPARLSSLVIARKQSKRVALEFQSAWLPEAGRSRPSGSEGPSHAAWRPCELRDPGPTREWPLPARKLNNAASLAKICSTRLRAVDRLHHENPGTFTCLLHTDDIQRRVERF